MTDKPRVSRDDAEAYIYATDAHREQPAWDDIMERVYPLVAEMLRDDGEFDADNGSRPTLDEIRDQCMVEDHLIGLGQEAQNDLFERFLKRYGIFE